MKKATNGFTIVELLIVIVIIVILAAISVVMYNGIQNRAAESTLRADLRSAATKIGLEHANDGMYPTTENATVTSSEGITIRYESTDGASYCMSAWSDRESVSPYHIVGGGSVTEGACDGHVRPGVAAVPTRLGYTNVTGQFAGSNQIRVPIGSIPDGSWMIVVLAYNSSSTLPPPAGWTTLQNRRTTGTLSTSIYGKIKESGDSANQDFAMGNRTTTNGVIMWGEGAAAPSTWTIGPFGDRAVNGSPTTSIAPSLTTTTANSLVLSIASERTIAAESNYTSMSGAAPWVWIPQTSENTMQTIAVGVHEQLSSGASPAVTVVYPNPVAANGAGLQIALPPES